MMMILDFNVHPAKGSEGYAVTVVQGWAFWSQSWVPIPGELGETGESGE